MNQFGLMGGGPEAAVRKTTHRFPVKPDKPVPAVEFSIYTEFVDIVFRYTDNGLAL